MTKTALIGHTGFVGANLLAQNKYDDLYNSKNIAEIQGQEYDEVTISAASAEKWRANKDPESDLASIKNLTNHLKHLRANRVILISTVDVYPVPVNVNENTEIDQEQCNAYGKNRRFLEMFVEKKFISSHIIRLPGLFGPGLKKNIIYDFLHGNETHKIDSRGKFQFYSLANLSSDIKFMVSQNIPVLNMATEPLNTKDIAKNCSIEHFTNEVVSTPACYDFRSIHSSNKPNNQDGYLYTKNQVTQSMLEFIRGIKEGKDV